MIKSKLLLPLTLLYAGLFMVISPSFMYDNGFRDSYYSIMKQFGGIFIISGIVYYFFLKLSNKIDLIDSRMKELDSAGIDKIKIEGKNSFRHVFDEISSKNYVVDLKILADIETIHENLYFIKDFLKNKRYDTKVTLLISKPDNEDYEKQVTLSLGELFEIKNHNTNKKISIHLTKERATFNSIIYDSNVWLIFNGKREFENSINLNTRTNSSLGKQVTDFFESLFSRALQLEQKQ
jgi:hypothetical protein